MKSTVLIAGVLASFSAALASTMCVAAALLPIEVQFGDWTASCSTIEHSCGAATYSMEGGATLTLQRFNALDRNWQVRLYSSDPKAQDAKVIQVVIGSVHSSLLAAKDWQSGTRPNEIVLISPESADMVFTGLIHGMDMALAAGEPGAVGRDYFSLKGVSASLLWIDEQQSRVGSARQTETPKSLATVAPAVRKARRYFEGEGEAADAAPTAHLDTLPPAVIALRRDDKTCSPLTIKAGEDDDEGYGVQWLGADTALFMVPCFATPRQPINRYILATAPDFTDARVLAFQSWDESLSPPGPSRKRGRDVPWLSLDPVFGRLSSTQTDNYGTLTQTWRWDGNEAHLIEVKQKHWQGQVEGPWSVLWQAPTSQR